jgi:NADH-quinone oxidoreductase subunit L
MNSLPLWLIPLAPIAAALVAAVLALTRRAERAAPYVTVAAIVAAGLAAAGHPPSRLAARAGGVAIEWLRLAPGFRITLGVHLDALSWVMVAVVCFVSLLVQIYSIGYMRGEAGYARYFAYLSLFTASMLGLVVADNLFQLYVCWELVGICSYLLIGFWWQKPSAVDAAKKAFVVTRFGDVGFLVGVLLLASVAGSFDFHTVGRTVLAISHGGNIAVPLVSAQVFLTLAPLLLFCGAVGKSAQFPLHIWLPDAMEGPTPVSALIHAATMVAAGVYMVARLLPIFAASEIAMNTVMVVGGITALMAATIALVQTDIKRVLAYSTISQLGYMMLGLGAGAQEAGMFHLVTHAMFKALLFLAAGSVIHAMHAAVHPSGQAPRIAEDPHTEHPTPADTTTAQPEHPNTEHPNTFDPNDLRRMGGLSRRMPATAIASGIGVLALAGFPGLSGFWSKDAILTALLTSGSPAAWVLLVVAIVVAGLTAFYATRMWMLAFAGEPRSEAAAHIHESPPVMTLPLWALAVPSLFLGGYLAAGGRFEAFLSLTGEAGTEPMNLTLTATASLVALAGILLAWRLYRAPAAVDPVERWPGYGLFANLWYVDAFWTKAGAASVLALGRAVAWFDRAVVDGTINGIGALCRDTGRELRRTTNGQAQAYAAVFLAGIVVAALALMLNRPRDREAGGQQPTVEMRTAARR